MLRDADPHQANASKPFLKHLGPLLLLTLIFFLNFIARITLAPLVPNIEADLSLTHAAAGSLFFLISLGYFITLTGSGFISSRLNHKRTIVLSNTALGLVLIATAFCKGLWTIRLGLFLLGMTAGLYLPSGIAMLTALVSSRHWGKAIAIHELAPNVSFVAAPLISEAILLQFSWRIVFIFLGLAALTMSPLFARFSRGGQFLGEALSSLSVRKLFTNLSFWAMVLLFSLGVSSTLGIYTMLPLYLVTDHGMDRNLANTLIALSRIACVAMAFVGGWATDRFGPKQTIRVVLLLAGVLTLLLGAVSSSYILYIVFLQPLVAVCFFPAGFAAMSLITSPKLRHIAVSLTVPMAFLFGGGLVPILIGFVGDMASFAVGISMIGGLIITGSILSGLLKFND